MKVYGGGGAAKELPNSGISATQETKKAREAWEMIAPIAERFGYEAEKVRYENKMHEVEKANAPQQQPTVTIERGR